MVRSIAFFLSVLFGLAVIAGCKDAGSEPRARGGAFSLVDVKGRTVTNRTFEGRPYAMFFGFTRCPDICPTTLAKMTSLYKALGPDAKKLSILFVSVDPEHDKPQDIASFLLMFDAPIVGLTGSAKQLQVLEKQFGIYVEKVPLPGGDYTIDHTAGVLLVDRDGKFVEMLDPNGPPAASVTQLRKLIRG